MRVMLVSGLSLDIKRIRLYNEVSVSEIAQHRARAAKALGGRGLSLGVIGTPGLTFAAEAAAVSLLSSFLSSAAESTGLAQVAEANTKYEALLKSGEYLSITEIAGLESPDPSAWLGWRNRTRFVHNGDEFISVETEAAMLMIRWRDVCAYNAPLPEQTLDKQEVRSKWMTIPVPTTEPHKIKRYGGYDFGSHLNGSITVRYEGELIGFPSEDDFKKWADQHPLKQKSAWKW